MPAPAVVETTPETTDTPLLVGGPGEPGFPPVQPPVEPPRTEGTPASKVDAGTTPTQIITTPQAPIYRFKSWDEAEKSEHEAKTRMHEATTEAAQLRKQLAEAQTVRDTRSMEEYLSGVNREMHQEMRAIPDTDPEIVQKQLVVMNKYNHQIAQRVADQVMAKALEQAQRTVDERVYQVSSAEKTERLIVDRLEKEQLTLPAHRKLFDTTLAQVKADTPNFKALTTEEQFALVLTPMHEMLGMTVDRLTDVAKQNAAAVAGAEVMGRGARAPAGPAAETKPTTLGQQILDHRRNPERKLGG